MSVGRFFVFVEEFFFSSFLYNQFPLLSSALLRRPPSWTLTAATPRPLKSNFFSVFWRPSSTFRSALTPVAQAASVLERGAELA